jgi:hypothetical protein
MENENDIGFNIKKKNEATDIYETVLNRIPFDFKKRDFFNLIIGKLCCYHKRNKISKS